ncbi:MAG: phosphoadenylyl-sulfate reductase [Patescibacteria group bacterium]|nr:phosphoadenylyl-sulfate reductase [Patescibacteria group bacterium]
MGIQQTSVLPETLRNLPAVSEGACCGSCHAGGCAGPSQSPPTVCEGKKISLTPDVYPVAQPSEELLAELDEASRLLEGKTPEEILAWAVERYYPRFTMATAFGPEGCVILSMLAQIEPRVYIFNLDTGYQFNETLELRDRIAEKYGIEVDMQQPDTTVEQYERMHGGPLYLTNPDQCCFDRKVRILYRVTRNFEAWASGIRRDQSAIRAGTPTVRWDKKFGLIKVSPLANWTKQDVWKRIVDEQVPYNPMHDQGYPSVGCWPCTRRVLDGDPDERAGRWTGFAKTECGLHSD